MKRWLIALMLLGIFLIPPKPARGSLTAVGTAIALGKLFIDTAKMVHKSYKIFVAYRKTAQEGYKLYKEYRKTKDPRVLLKLKSLLDIKNILKGVDEHQQIEKMLKKNHLLLKDIQKSTRQVLTQMGKLSTHITKSLQQHEFRREYTDALVDFRTGHVMVFESQNPSDISAGLLKLSSAWYRAKTKYLQTKPPKRLFWDLLLVQIGMGLKLAISQKRPGSFPSVRGDIDKTLLMKTAVWWGDRTFNNSKQAPFLQAGQKLSASQSKQLVLLSKQAQTTMLSLLQTALKRRARWQRHPSGRWSTAVMLQNGKRHGSWRRWSNAGQVLERGAYWNNHPDGTWTGYYPTGRVKVKKVYQKGKPARKWRWWYKDGSYKRDRWWYKNGRLEQEQNYQGLKPHGTYRWWYKDGKPRAEKHYLRGEKTGTWKWWYKNGRPDGLQQYRKGQRHGSWKAWYDNGKPKSQHTYAEGKKQGSWLDWYDNGNKKQLVTYQDAQRHGIWKRWQRNGLPLERRTYRKGILHGMQRRWHVNGKPKQEGLLYPGRVKHGVWKQWNAQGILTRQVAYKMGAKDGKSMEWDESGFLTREETYALGRKQLQLLYRPLAQGRKEANLTVWDHQNKVIFKKRWLVVHSATSRPAKKAEAKKAYYYWVQVDIAGRKGTPQRLKIPNGGSHAFDLKHASGAWKLKLNTLVKKDRIVHISSTIHSVTRGQKKLLSRPRLIVLMNTPAMISQNAGPSRSFKLKIYPQREKTTSPPSFSLPKQAKQDCK